MKSNKRFLFLILIIILLFGCGSDNSKNNIKPATVPPQVTVDKPLVQDITEYVYYTGNLMASEFADIKSKVEGHLVKISFRSGSIVKKGDVLFIIDQKPFKAKVKQAEAEVKVMKAELNLAKAKLKRKEIAYKSRAISEVELLEARANVDVYNANLKKAESILYSAKLDLADTVIKAPFQGRIGRNLVDIGNLITPTISLTNIVKDDPIYAYVYMNERDFLYYKKHNDTNCECEKNKVDIKLADSDEYLFSGYLDFMANKLDSNTGTIEIRGVFQNNDHIIYPGLFAKMRIPIAFRKDALLITERAIGIDQRGEYLYVVNDDNVVEYRHVETGPVINGNKLIYKGINKADKIIVKGILRAKPGIKVSPMTPKQEQEMVNATKSESKQ